MAIQKLTPIPTSKTFENKFLSSETNKNLKSRTVAPLKTSTFPLWRISAVAIPAALGFLAAAYIDKQFSPLSDKNISLSDHSISEPLLEQSSENSSSNNFYIHTASIIISLLIWYYCKPKKIPTETPALKAPFSPPPVSQASPAPAASSDRDSFDPSTIDSAVAPTQTTGNIIYSDGSSYEGELNEGRPNGKGKAVYLVPGGCPDYTTIEGPFIDGKPHGHVHVTYKNVGTFEGVYVQGLKHGPGILVFHNEEMKVGDWLNDEFHFGLVIDLISGKINVYKDGQMQSDYDLQEALNSNTPSSGFTKLPPFKKEPIEYAKPFVPKKIIILYPDNNPLYSGDIILHTTGDACENYDGHVIDNLYHGEGTLYTNHITLPTHLSTPTRDIRQIGGIYDGIFDSHYFKRGTYVSTKDEVFDVYKDVSVLVTSKADLANYGLTLGSTVTQQPIPYVLGLRGPYKEPYTTEFYEGKFTYEGGLRFGRPHHYGKLTEIGKHPPAIYEGSFAFGKPEGLGRMIKPDFQSCLQNDKTKFGSIFEGYYKNGRPWGAGIYVCPELIKVGMWQGNSLEFGVFIHEDGRITRWKNGPGGLICKISGKQTSAGTSLATQPLQPPQLLDSPPNGLHRPTPLYPQQFLLQDPERDVQDSARDSSNSGSPRIYVHSESRNQRY